MIDREKVIEGLKLSYTCSNVDECNTLVPQQLVLEAIALLKAQEPVEPIVVDGTRYIYCGNCKRPLCEKSDDNVPTYCEECGRAVKWE